MKLSIKILSLVLAFAMLICGVSLLTLADGIQIGGDEEDDPTWTDIKLNGNMDPDDDGSVTYEYAGGILDVQYVGRDSSATKDFLPEETRDWAKSNYPVSSLKIGDGVTVIGTYTFKDMVCAKDDQDAEIPFTLELPATLTAIKEYAFDGCNINKIVYAGSRSDWDELSKSIAEHNGVLNYTLAEMEQNDVEIVFLVSSLAGDVDGNGTVEVADATLLAQYIVKSATASDLDLSAADMNDDSVYDVNDVVLILQAISE